MGSLQSGTVNRNNVLYVEQDDVRKAEPHRIYQVNIPFQLKVWYKTNQELQTLEDKKNPDEDNVFKLYSLVANPDEIAAMRQNYLAGGYGYGHAKNELHAVLMRKFSEEREKFDYYINHTNELDQKLQEGEAKAEIIARTTRTN